jgi:hypothetical protein
VRALNTVSIKDYDIVIDVGSKFVTMSKLLDIRGFGTRDDTKPIYVGEDPTQINLDRKTLIVVRPVESDYDRQYWETHEATFKQ